jgi:hypothetical protein
MGCHLSTASPSIEFRERFARVMINSSTGDKTPVPRGEGLTIINLFDEFSTDCSSGSRFETMERLNSLQPAGKILLIFSDKNFSLQDLENFKAILPMSESLVRGDIEAVRPHLTSGKLLVVLDGKGNVIWHEKRDMSEEQVVSEVSKLMHSASE